MGLPGRGIAFIDAFWKAASALDPTAATLDEAIRFPFCTQACLAAEVAAAGCLDVEVVPIEVNTPFADFAAFWRPFTLGAGPAPGYLDTLGPDERLALEQRLRDDLGDGVRDLMARVWAVRCRPGIT